MHLPAFTHAGGIVLRETPDGVRVLAVRPSTPDGDVWVLPKGHIEPGEDAVEAAKREVVEEAGVVGADPTFVGYVAYRAGDEDVVCALYAMTPEGEVAAEEDRERAWLDIASLERAMPFPDTVALVEAAVRARDVRRAPPRRVP
ncbi:MAG: NUDIX hydrolase [Planctomycetota bacterium]